MSIKLIEPDSFKLIRVTGTAYYQVLIQEVNDRYYVIKRSGRNGARYYCSPFLVGHSIGSSKGYEELELAMEHAQIHVDAKCTQPGLRKYRNLEVGEAFIKEIDDKGREGYTLLCLKAS